jgi:alpha-ketoglutarate-dependent taurine dioxygenase
MTRTNLSSVSVCLDTEPLDALRRNLTESTALAWPEWLVSGRSGSAPPAELARRMRRSVEAEGVATVVLDKALEGAEFLSFGKEWGTPINEHASLLQPFVEAGCILNLFAHWKGTQDPDRQPLATAPILLHSESSRRPLAEQPRYLLFSCLAQAETDEGAQTAVVRMQDVFERLSEQSRETLARLRLGADLPAVLRHERERAVFSFRDFGAEPTIWASDASVDARDAEAALVDLLRCLYSRDLLRALTWQRHTLVALDNHRVFHGRTAVRMPRVAGRGRWIQRLRIREY